MTSLVDETSQNNLSSSTLRRKLFDGFVEDDDSSDDGEREHCHDERDKKAPAHIMSSPIKQNDPLLSPELLPLTPISKMTRFTGRNVRNLSLFV